jgi:oxygen-independent coproporphyrinogen-3 oxidase
MDGRRFYNPESWEDYLIMAESGETARDAEGNNSREDRMFERMMMGLRQVRGTDSARFKRDFGVSPEVVWPRTIADMKARNLMTHNNERIRLTERGMQVMNGVLVSLMEEMDSKPQKDA